MNRLGIPEHLILFLSFLSLLYLFYEYKSRTDEPFYGEKGYGKVPKIKPPPYEVAVFVFYSFAVYGSSVRLFLMYS